MRGLIEIVVVGLALIGAMTIYGAWKRYWRSLTSHTRNLLLGLLLTPVASAMAAFGAAVILLLIDWGLQSATSWGGVDEERTLVIWVAGASAVATLLYLLERVSDFALARERQVRRSRPDPVGDALEADIEARLTAEERNALYTNMNTISAFPSLFDELDSGVAYEEMEKVLAPHPDLQARFFERFDPYYELKLSTYLYGLPREQRWYRLRSIWRLLRSSTADTSGPERPGAVS